MKKHLLKTYLLELRDQSTINIIPQLVKNIMHYFNDYFNDYEICYKDCIYNINLFEYNIPCISMKFIYTESPHYKADIFFEHSLSVILDYNKFYYERAEILQLIYSLFNSINIYGITEA